MQQLNSSFRDIFMGGYVFSYENNIYRCINKSYKEHYDYFMSSGLYEKLVSEQYIVSHVEINDISNFNLDDNTTYKVIKPLQLPYITYPYEWSFNQLKDAAILTLKILLESLKYNMILKDATAYNVQFYNGQPVFIDTLSFEKYEEGKVWQAYSQFCRHFLAPLALIAYTDYRMYQLSLNFLDGIPLDYAAKLLPSKTKLKLGLLMHLHLNAQVHKKAENNSQIGNREYFLKKQNLVNMIENLVNTVLKIDYNTEKGESTWNGYYSFTNYNNESFLMKENLLIDFIKQCNSHYKIVDLGANNGHFSRLVSKQYPESIIISSDMDYHAVDANYSIIKHTDEYKNIYPVITDLANPVPSIGWQNKERDSFIERLKDTDITLALALVHHITITNNIPFYKLSEFFALFTKYLIIEWVPSDDSQTIKILDVKARDYSYYTLENFEKDFKKEFNIIDKKIIDNTKRTLYLMKKL